MPFTLAHPAVLWPLHRRLGRLRSFSALVIGSMVPDLAHFLPIGLLRDDSHSLASLLLFSLPVGFAAYVVFQLLIAPMATAIAPEPLRLRLPEAPGRLELTPARAAAVAISLLLGGALHLAWDAFTHEGGFGVWALPFLRRPVPIVAGYAPCLYTVFQHASTILGTVAVAAWIAHWYHRAPVRPAAGEAAPLVLRLSILAVLVAPAGIAVVAAVWPLVFAAPISLDGLRRTIAITVLSGGMVFLSTLLATSICWRLRPGLGSRRELELREAIASRRSLADDPR